MSFKNMKILIFFSKILVINTISLKMCKFVLYSYPNLMYVNLKYIHSKTPENYHFHFCPRLSIEQSKQDHG